MKPARVINSIDGEVLIEDFSYDGGRLSRIKLTSKDEYHGTQMWNQIFSYNGKGNLVHVKTPEEEAILKYDTRGRLIEETVTLVYRSRPIKKERYVQISTFEYGPNDMLMRRINTSSYDDGPVKKWTFLYETDSMGQLTKVINVEDDSTFTYEYSEVPHYLSALNLPICFLTVYGSTLHLNQKYTVVRKNNRGFPLELNQVDENGSENNLRIRYAS